MNKLEILKHWAATSSRLTFWVVRFHRVTFVCPPEGQNLPPEPMTMKGVRGKFHRFDYGLL